MVQNIIRDALATMTHFRKKVISVNTITTAAAKVVSAAANIEGPMCVRAKFDLWRDLRRGMLWT